MTARKPKVVPKTIGGHIVRNVKRITLASVIAVSVKELLIVHPVDIAIDVFSGVVVEISRPAFAFAKEYWE